MKKITITVDEGTSLSARRAWIEILYYGDDLTFSESLSARRAWIEMHNRYGRPIDVQVALRKESVDRNFSFWLLA